MRRAALSRVGPLFWIAPLALSVIALAVVASSAFADEAAATGSAVESGSPDAAPAEAQAFSPVPTHRQTAIIRGNVSGQPQVTLTCFCLTPDDRIVAGCVGNSGELRVFDADGKYLETWSAPVKPEAIFVRADGRILMAGEGQLVRLAPDGQVELQTASPHAAALSENPEKIREEVIQQAKQQAEQFVNQAEMFDQAIQRADEEIVKLEEQIAGLEEADEESPRKRMLQQRIAAFQRNKEQYENIKAQFAERAGQAPSGELTEEEIEQRVKSSIAYKLKASSISASEEEVFLATRAVAGYGYQIWRMDADFENGTQIVSDLRGCCGQMDVKANEHGVFVAENSRYRVCRFDREGNMVCHWGHSDRQGVEGFGSCCNPMNVAFGPGDTVYTAEDTSGRIKRYSVEGKLLSLIGTVDLVPGCKNVSIAINGDGSQVYMLDITRHHIVRLDARPADEVAKEAAAGPPTPVSSAVARGLKLLLGRDNE